MKKAYNNFHYALFIPICIIPIAVIISQIGQFIYTTTGMPFAYFLIKFQEICVTNLPLMLAASVAYFTNKQRSGIAVFSGVIAFLILTQIIDSYTLKTAFNLSFQDVDIAFSYLNNTLFGILCGLLAAQTFNRFQNLRLPTWLAFFSGRRSIPILTTIFSILVSIILYYLWPLLFHFFINCYKFLIATNPFTQAIAITLNQVLSIFLSQNFITNFVVLPSIQALILYITSIAIPLILMYYCYYKKAHYYYYIFVVLIAISTFYSQNNSILIIVQLMISPFLWLSYCILLGISVYINQTLHLTNTAITVLFACCYFLALRYAIQKNWMLDPWNETFITAMPVEAIEKAIDKMGGFENIKSFEIEEDILVFHVYDYDFIDFKKIKQDTQWKIKQREDYSFYIIDDIYTLQLLYQDICDLKNHTLKTLVL